MLKWPLLSVTAACPPGAMIFVPDTGLPLSSKTWPSSLACCPRVILDKQKMKIVIVKAFAFIFIPYFDNGSLTEYDILSRVFFDSPHNTGFNFLSDPSAESKKLSLLELRSHSLQCFQHLVAVFTFQTV